MRLHVDQHWRELFLVKLLAWEHEREYRWIVRCESDTDFLIDIRESLVGILLGDQFPEAYRPIVGNFARFYSTSVAILGWHNGVPQPSPTHWRLLGAMDDGA